MLKVVISFKKIQLGLLYIKPFGVLSDLRKGWLLFKCHKAKEERPSLYCIKIKWHKTARNTLAQSHAVPSQECGITDKKNLLAGQSSCTSAMGLRTDLGIQQKMEAKTGE